jgi:DNA-directed RNA polymerase specialized sigma24 family protein
MTTEPDGSVTRWIGDLVASADPDPAAQKLWERYFERLVHLARDRLRAISRGPADAEDAALSAFDSFCRGVAAGRFPCLRDRDDLWPLLVTITVRKASDQVRRERRLKRGGGRVRSEQELGRAGPDDGAGLDEFVGREPTPEFAAIMAEQYLHLLGRLADKTLCHIATWKLEGDSNDKIAARLGCGRRTIERKLGVIRSIWSAAEAD